MSVFVFPQYRGQGYCGKMIESVVKAFKVPLKVTFEINNHAALRCYQRYFKPYNNIKNLRFLTNLWNENENDYRMMLRK